MPKLFLGKKIFLWEIGFIGEAIVKEITNVPTFHELRLA